MSSSRHLEALTRLTAPRRNHFFYGKRMDVQHFEMEQDYGKLKQWLLNRLSLGTGVICGLRVRISDGQVCIDPGLAIDGWGREIIVPIRSCLDPLSLDDGCCGSHKPAGEPQAGRAASDDDAKPADGVYTLSVCYHECLADHEPVLVSDCSTRSHCAAGTTVESFCFKLTQGITPLGDPDWCANLWKRPAPPANTQPPAVPGVAVVAAPAVAAAQPGVADALASRRHLLCSLFDDACDPPPVDPCVPIAAILVKGGQVAAVESCLVRPRIYSNAQLLDIILCLADRLDECCGGHTPTVPMLQVRSVQFLARRDNTETLVATMATPLQETVISPAAGLNSIRVQFSRPLAQDQHKPTTHGVNETDPDKHNVGVRPEVAQLGLNYVPGSLAIEAPDTIRFDLAPRRPFAANRVWQKGRYTLRLRGTEQPGRPALADIAGTTLDGEPIVPANGVISGDATAGGDFAATFVIGEAPPQETLRVRSVEFLSRRDNAESVVATMATPLQDTAVSIGASMNALRVRFSAPLAQDQHQPTTHGAGDADFKRHNIQVLPDDPLNGLAYVPGGMTIEGPETIRFDLTLQPPYARDRGWQKGRYQLFLRGTEHLPSQQALADASGAALDGEAVAPAGGVISGDQTAGGDFSAFFVVGGEAPRETLRVTSVDFVRRIGQNETVVGAAQSPLAMTEVEQGFDAIRITFTAPLSEDPAPTTHALNDASFDKHSVLVLVSADDVPRVGVRYLPGELSFDAPNTLRFKPLRNTRLVNADGRFIQTPLRLELVLKGTSGAGEEPPILNTSNDALDGEPITPGNGVISGDGTLGGNFKMGFTVHRP